MTERAVPIIVWYVLVILITFLIGYLSGIWSAVEAGTYVARHFFNVSVDHDLIQKAIFQYKNQIDCLRN